MGAHSHCPRDLLISGVFPLQTKHQHCLGWQGWGRQAPAPQRGPLPGSVAPWTRLLLSSFKDHVLWEGKGPRWSLGDLQERQGWETGTQIHGLHRKRGSGGPVIYLCRIPPRASLSCICSYLFYSAGLSKTNKASAPLLPSSPAVATDLKSGGWEGRLLLLPAPAPAPAWQCSCLGQCSGGSATTPLGVLRLLSSLFGLPGPAAPDTVHENLDFGFPPAFPPFSSPCRSVEGVFFSLGTPSPGSCAQQLSLSGYPAAACAQSSSWLLIPKFHHGCSSVDLSASPSVTL